jgi:hypothetical protein
MIDNEIHVRKKVSNTCKKLSNNEKLMWPMDQDVHKVKDWISAYITRLGTNHFLASGFQGLVISVGNFLRNSFGICKCHNYWLSI